MKIPKYDICGKENVKGRRYKRKELRKVNTWQEKAEKYIKGEKFLDMVTRRKSVDWLSDKFKILDKFAWHRQAKICESCMVIK